MGHPVLSYLDEPLETTSLIPTITGPSSPRGSKTPASNLKVLRLVAGSSFAPSKATLQGTFPH